MVAFPEMTIGLLHHYEQVCKYQQGLLRIGCAKFFSDGSIQTETGYLKKPHHQHASHRGLPTNSLESMTDIIKKLYQNDWQVVIHANGDAAIEEVIRAHPKAILTSTDSNAKPNGYTQVSPNHCE